MSRETVVLGGKAGRQAATRLCGSRRPFVPGHVPLPYFTRVLHALSWMRNPRTASALQAPDRRSEWFCPFLTAFLNPIPMAALQDHRVPHGTHRAPKKSFVRLSSPLLPAVACTQPGGSCPCRASTSVASASASMRDSSPSPNSCTPCDKVGYMRRHSRGTALGQKGAKHSMAFAWQVTGRVKRR